MMADSLQQPRRSKCCGVRYMLRRPVFSGARAEGKLKKTLNIFGLLLELPAEIALVGTLLFSFSLWMLWGLFWFPIIDWVYARIAG